MRVCLNLEYLMERDNRSRYWLVKQLDSNYKVVNRMINNETNAIYFDTIAKLCEIFRCTPNDLFIIK